MTTKLTEQIAVKIEPALKNALDNLLILSPRDEFPTMGDLLRDIISSEVKKRLKKFIDMKASK